VNDLMGGHVSSSFIAASGARKVEPSGKARLLAVSTPTRSPLLPHVPSFAELGIKGLHKDSWVGFLAPEGTPKAAIDKFAADLCEVLANAEVRERFATQGVVPTGSTPQEFAQRIQGDKAYWVNAIKTTGIKLK
jgi:tripartite-type tricarboxylate transporter receptor subunit TctC